MTARATGWSITINNPTEQDTKVVLPAGWSLIGQYEQGAEGTVHFQGYLKTPQVRFSAVKNHFPRAHIEVVRNKEAIQRYVSKEETRIALFDANVSKNIFQWQEEVAKLWDARAWHDYYMEQIEMQTTLDGGQIALRFLDHICSDLIAGGAQGLEFISVNPMWRSSWKRFYSSIINRYATAQDESQKASTAQEGSPPSSGESQPEQEG